MHGSQAVVNRSRRRARLRVVVVAEAGWRSWARIACTVVAALETVSSARFDRYRLPPPPLMRLPPPSPFAARAHAHAHLVPVRVRFHIIRNARIENVGKSQSCMVSKLRMIWKQTVSAAVVVAIGAPVGAGIGVVTWWSPMTTSLIGRRQVRVQLIGHL